MTGRQFRWTEWWFICKSVTTRKISYVIKEASKKEKADVGDSLYSVRCLVFHNYGGIPSEAGKLIEDINEIFEKVVIALLIKFDVSCSK